MLPQKHIKHGHNTSENVYYCDVCTKSCQNKNVLKNHLKSVHGGRHYNCESCEKSFSEARSLKKHIDTIHKGQKEHKCESCGKLFSRHCWFEGYIG